MRHFWGLASGGPFVGPVVASGAGGSQVPVSHVCSESKSRCRTYGDALGELLYYRAMAAPRYHLRKSIAEAPTQEYDLQNTAQRCHINEATNSRSSSVEWGRTFSGEETTED